MCFALPGKIVKKDGDRVFVDYGEQKIEAGIVDGDYEVGDFVIVQGKIVVDKVPAEQVAAWQDFIKEI